MTMGAGGQGVDAHHRLDNADAMPPLDCKRIEKVRFSSTAAFAFSTAASASACASAAACACC